MAFGLDDWGNVDTNLFVGAAAGLALTGFRVGPMRAITLAYKSRFFGGPLFHKSVRKAEIDRLRTDLDSLDHHHEAYVLVKGDMGVGKSCLIDTVLHEKNGVVRIDILAGTSQDDVLKKCFCEITGSPFTFFDEDSVRRVLFCYRFIFSSSPTLVMAMRERPPGTDYAQVTGAVRSLSRMGVKVIVDAAPNSAPPELTTTKRQIVINIGVLTQTRCALFPN